MSNLLRNLIIGSIIAIAVITSMYIFASSQAATYGRPMGNITSNTTSDQLQSSYEEFTEDLSDQAFGTTQSQVSNEDSTFSIALTVVKKIPAILDFNRRIIQDIALELGVPRFLVAMGLMMFIILLIMGSIAFWRGFK